MNMDLSIRIMVIPCGKICGDGAETRCNGAGSQGKGDGKIPGTVYLPGLSCVYSLYEKKGRETVLLHGKNIVQHNEKGLYMPKLSGHIDDGAEVWVLLRERFGETAPEYVGLTFFWLHYHF
jgi:hypothetical protein